MLAEKPLGFSEILEALAIDSGHLSYHLENLGDLLVHAREEKYKLSSIGLAAVKLMGGVEEQPKSISRKTKPRRVITKAFSVVLAAALIVTGFYLATFAVSVSSATLNQDNQNPANFSIMAGGTFAFNVTLFNWGAPLPVGSVWPGTYLAPTGPNQWTFFVPHGTDTFAKELIWLDLRFNFTAIMQSLLQGTPVELPNNLTLKVYMPDGLVATNSIHAAYGAVENAVDPWTWGAVDHYVSSGFQVNALGTYKFEITNNGSSNWNGTLMPYVQWQQIGRPYFYYGVASIVIALAYLMVSLIELRIDRKAKENLVDQVPSPGRDFSINLLVKTRYTCLARI
jgi:hypothetical protein